MIKFYISLCLITFLSLPLLLSVHSLKSQMFPWLDNTDCIGPPEMTKVGVCWGQHFAQNPGNILKDWGRSESQKERETRVKNVTARCRPVIRVFLWHALWLTSWLTNEDDITSESENVHINVVKEFNLKPWTNLKLWLRGEKCHWLTTCNILHS